MNQNKLTNSQDDQLDLIARTVLENSQQLDKHTGQLDKHTQQLDKHTQQLDKHTELLDKHTQQLDKIIFTVVDHTGRLDRIEERLQTVVTRKDHQEVMNALDTVIKLAKKKDEELTMMSHGNQRLRRDIEKIKPLVGLT